MTNWKYDISLQWQTSKGIKIVSVLFLDDLILGEFVLTYFYLEVLS